MSSRFITENEALEIRKKRQEEWEKVRKPDEPKERPEEAYDNRSLFDKLQEQKQKKDLEYEEAHKLKNMIKGLDDDEIQFLDLVDRTKLAADRSKTLEEEEELNDYRNRVATLQEQTLDHKMQAEINVNKPKTNTNRTSQTKLLQGILLKKTTKKRKCLDDENVQKDCLAKINKPSCNKQNTKLTCIGILPGLGFYNDSTSGDESSDSDTEEETTQNVHDLDLCGRTIIKKDKISEC